ncbi:MAG TPA: dihydrofolate reductase [Burkholderiales bacterium]|jgi:dihydrofolate reductase
MSHPPGPRVYLVAAVASNGIIGVNGRLPWHFPEELRHFKEVTLGHPVIMGRRTWESLKGPLSGRKNIVVTRTPGYQAPGITVAPSLQAALGLCADAPKAMVIGGSRLFEESLPIAHGLELTEIHRDYPGDTWFPAYDRSKWREKKREARTASDGTRFDYVLYEKT